MDLTRVKTEAPRLLDADDLPGAFGYAQLAKDLDPRDAEAWFLFAECHAQRGDLDEAIRGYEQAIDMQPDNATFYYRLGTAYWKKGDLDKAALNLVRARDANPSQPDYLADLGAVLVDHGRIDDGITLLEKSHLEKPESERCMYFLGFSYIGKAYQDWIEVNDGARVPPGKYAQAPHVVRRAEELKAKAEALGSANPDLIKGLEDLGNDIRRMTSRHPRGLWWLGLVYISGGLAWAYTNMLAGGSVVALGILFVISCLAPMYIYFSRSILGAEKNLGLELGTSLNLIKGYFKVIDYHGYIYKRHAGIFGFALTSTITMFIIPIVTLWNFYKNYVQPGERAAGLAMMGVTALALSGLVTFASDAGRAGTTQSAAINTAQNVQTPHADTEHLTVKPDVPPSGAKKDGQTALARPEPAQRDEGVQANSAKIAGIGIKATDASNIQLESGSVASLVKLSGIKPVPGQKAAEVQEAAAFLTRLIKGQQISCQSKDKKEYLCTLDDSGEDIAEALILAGLAQPETKTPSSGNSYPIAIKLYALQAGNFASGDPEKIWKVIDPNCAFIDENGGRLSAEEVRPKSQQFLSSIRNARIKYKIYNVALNEDKLIVHAQSELNFELSSQLLFIQDWTHYIKTDMILQTWHRNGKLWQIVETKNLRPELLRQVEQSSGQASPLEKAISITKLSVCAKQCSDTAMQCPAETNRSCSAEYRACIANCKQ